MTAPELARGKLQAEDLTMAELLAHAHAIEIEAMERYAELTEQMEVHNNKQLAAVFRKLGEVERRHAEDIESRMTGYDIPQIAEWEYAWPGFESPEMADYGETHYLMTPWHALNMALKGEQRAHEFFRQLSHTATDPGVRKLAAEYAKEEFEHVCMVEALLSKEKKPPEEWDLDPDPPQSAE